MTAQDRLNKTLQFLHKTNKPSTIKEILKGIGSTQKEASSLQYILTSDNARPYFKVKRKARSHMYSLSALGHCTQEPVDLDESLNLLVYLHCRVFTDRRWILNMCRA